MTIVKVLHHTAITFSKKIKYCSSISITITVKWDNVCWRNTECSNGPDEELRNCTHSVSQFAETQVCAYTLIRAKRVQQVFQNISDGEPWQAFVPSLFVWEKDKSGGQLLTFLSAGHRLEEARRNQGNYTDRCWNTIIIFKQSRVAPCTTPQVTWDGHGLKYPSFQYK